MDSRRHTTIRFDGLIGRREHQHIGSGAGCHHQKQTETGKAKKSCPAARAMTPKRLLLVTHARLVAILAKI